MGKPSLRDTGVASKQRAPRRKPGISSTQKIARSKKKGASEKLALSGPPATLERLRAALKTMPTGKFLAAYEQAVASSRKEGRTVRVILEVHPKGKPNVRVAKAETHPDNGAVLKTERALQAARERGRTRVAEILSGPDMLSAAAFADLLGTTRMTINTKRKKRQVLGFDGATRGYRFPKWQVGSDGKPFTALAHLFEKLGDDPWTVYRFLVQHHSELDGLTGHEALRRGKSDQVLEVADDIGRTFG